MKRVCLVVAVGVLAVAAAPAALAQTMYRCGNTYQDKPCADGQAGRVVGSTKSPAPTETARVCENGKCRDVPVTRGAAAPESPDVAAERAKWAAVSKDLALQHTAQKCVSMRKQVGGARPSHLKALQADMRQERCAWRGSDDFDAERRCAEANDPEVMARACAEYAKIER